MIFLQKLFTAFEHDVYNFGLYCHEGGNSSKGAHFVVSIRMNELNTFLPNFL